jgi:hypothetical protein
LYIIYKKVLAAYIFTSGQALSSITYHKGEVPRINGFVLDRTTSGNVRRSRSSCNDASERRSAESRIAYAGGWLTRCPSMG